MHAFVFFPAQSASAAIVDALDAVIRALARRTKSRAEDSVFLSEIATPQPQEVRVKRARIDGQVPKHLRGMFCTIIPTGLPHSLPVGGYHLFEGDGCLASVRLEDDGASFSFHHLKTEKLMAERELGRSSVMSVTAMKGFSGLTLLALTGLRNAVRWEKYSMSTANTNVMNIGNRSFALMEQSMPYELGLSSDGTTLECMDLLSMNGYNGPFSAHPVYSSFTDCYYSVSYTPSSSHDAAIIVVNSNAELVRTVPLHLGRKVMIHDAAVTKNYVVVLDLPVIISPSEILKEDGSLIRVHHDKPSRIGLFPVNATSEKEMIWFNVPTCAAFHTINAFEEDGKVVMFLCQLDDFKMNDDFTTNTSQLARYELDLDTKSVKIEKEHLDFSPWFGDSMVTVDLPTLNKKMYGRNARYAYGICLVKSRDSTRAFQELSGVWKYDMHERRLVDLVVFGEGAEACGQAEVIARGDGPEEDDAYIGAFVRDGNGDVAMRLYDAHTMSSKHVLSIHAPAGFNVPTGFHSSWIPEKKLLTMRRL